MKTLLALSWWLCGLAILCADDVADKKIVIESGRRVIGRIFLVKNDGVMLSDGKMWSADGHQLNHLPDGKALIECDSGPYVDGARFDQVVYPIGKMKWGSSTLLSFTTSPEKFLRWLKTKR